MLFWTARQGFSLLFWLSISRWLLPLFFSPTLLSQVWRLIWTAIFLQTHHEIENAFLLSDIFRNMITRRCLAHNLDTPIIWNSHLPFREWWTIFRTGYFQREKPAYSHNLRALWLTIFENNSFLISSSPTLSFGWSYHIQLFLSTWKFLGFSIYLKLFKQQ